MLHGTNLSLCYDTPFWLPLSVPRGDSSRGCTVVMVVLQNFPPFPATTDPIRVATWSSSDPLRVLFPHQFGACSKPPFGFPSTRLERIQMLTLHDSTRILQALLEDLWPASTLTGTF